MQRYVIYRKQRLFSCKKCCSAKFLLNGQLQMQNEECTTKCFILDFQQSFALVHLSYKEMCTKRTEICVSEDIVQH